MNDHYIPEEYRPISMWGYFGYSLLFAIPIICFMILCVFALGGARNINVRNYARSYFCWIVLLLILIGITIALGGSQILYEYSREFISNFR